MGAPAIFDAILHKKCKACTSNGVYIVPALGLRAVGPDTACDRTYDEIACGPTNITSHDEATLMSVVDPDAEDRKVPVVVAENCPDNLPTDYVSSLTRSNLIVKRCVCDSFMSKDHAVEIGNSFKRSLMSSVMSTVPHM